MTISKHCMDDRADRLTFIAINIGFGNEVMRVKARDNCYKALTDTGIILIKDCTTDLLVTAYIASINQIKTFYPGKEVPFRFSILTQNYKKKGYYSRSNAVVY